MAVIVDAPKQGKQAFVYSTNRLSRATVYGHETVQRRSMVPVEGRSCRVRYHVPLSNTLLVRVAYTCIHMMEEIVAKHASNQL